MQAGPETRDPPPPATRAEILHASTVALGDRAVLILGRSGSGKSALALALMALGADLVADDRTCLSASPDGPLATPPAAIAGRIEARGIGLLRARHRARARIVLAVDLDRVETERLPPCRWIDLAGSAVRLLHKVESPHFAAAILQYLKCHQDPE